MALGLCLIANNNDYYFNQNKIKNIIMQYKDII